jgi:hypothetical protein
VFFLKRTRLPIRDAVARIAMMKALHPDASKAAQFCQRKKKRPQTGASAGDRFNADDAGAPPALI